MNCRVGIGYDIHRLTYGRKLFIGGVEIPHSKGLLGHSDADALLHAISDALLGAAAEPDIGELFADSDPLYKGISSLELLKKVDGLVGSKGFVILNIDSVIICQEPNLKQWKEMIKENIAAALNISADCVSVKAKTNEGMAETGKGEAIACYAVAVLNKK